VKKKQDAGVRVAVEGQEAGRRRALNMAKDKEVEMRKTGKDVPRDATTGRFKGVCSFTNAK